MTDGWLVIPKWDKFQSRKDRHDPWIKDYVDQLDRDEYLDLTLTERGLLADLRRAYARADGTLRTRHVRSYIGVTPRQKHLQRLVDAGFLDISAAKPPPISGQVAARARGEVEVDVDLPKKVSTAKDNGTAAQRAQTWIANGLASEVPPERLGDVLADEFGITDRELIAGLVQLARGEET